MSTWGVLLHFHTLVNPADCEDGQYHDYDHHHDHDNEDGDIKRRPRPSYHIVDLDGPIAGHLVLAIYGNVPNALRRGNGDTETECQEFEDRIDAHRHHKAERCRKLNALHRAMLSVLRTWYVKKDDLVC